MPLSLIKKTQLHPDIQDLIGTYGSGYFLPLSVSGELVNFISGAIDNLSSVVESINGINGSLNISGLSGIGIYEQTGTNSIIINYTGKTVTDGVAYTTGDQIFSGENNFVQRLLYSGNDVATAIDIANLKSGTGSFITTLQTGAFYAASNPSGFITPENLNGLILNQLVKNNNIETIYKGQPVYISSAAGNNIIISKASNTGEMTSSKTLGLLAQDLLPNGTGYVITEGLLNGLNTNSAIEGDPVWLGPSGSLLYGATNKPYAPNHSVYLGVVTRSSQNNGAIYIHVQNGLELDELHTVNINKSFGLQNNDIIQYDSSSGLWFNRQLQTGSFVTTAQTGAFYPVSNPSGFLRSNQTGSFVTTNGTVSNIVSLTQAQFNLISNPSPSTVYLIVG